MHSHKAAETRPENLPTHPRRRIDAFRPPRAEDAAQIARLARETGLDANSTYAYLLLCTDFAATGAIVEDAGELVGFVLGYRPPERPDAYFVWQIAVRDDRRGQGLAHDLLHHAMRNALSAGMTFLEATVTPSNRASRALFSRFAERAKADFRELPGFSSHLFADGDHEEEVRIRIGPIDLAPRRAEEDA